MRHLDVSVMEDIDKFQIAIISNNFAKPFCSRIAMIADVVQWEEFKTTARRLYDDFLHPTISEFSIWRIDNFDMIVDEMGYKIIRTQQSLNKEKE